MYKERGRFCSIARLSVVGIANTVMYTSRRIFLKRDRHFVEKILTLLEKEKIEVACSVLQLQ